MPGRLAGLVPGSFLRKGKGRDESLQALEPLTHPVTNSLKLISESLFSSRSRNIRPASTGVWVPQAQGVRLAKAPGTGGRQCGTAPGRAGWSRRTAAGRLLPQYWLARCSSLQGAGLVRRPGLPGPWVLRVTRLTGVFARLTPSKSTASCTVSAGLGTASHRASGAGTVTPLFRAVGVRQGPRSARHSEPLAGRLRPEGRPRGGSLAGGTPGNGKGRWDMTGRAGRRCRQGYLCLFFIPFPVPLLPAPEPSPGGKPPRPWSVHVKAQPGVSRERRPALPQHLT